MLTLELLALLQERLAQAVLCGSSTPLTLSTLPPELHETVARLDQDGLQIASLLVARLRFERLIQSCKRASEGFAHDPAEFAGQFRRYHEAVPPTALDGWGEAELFERWLAERG